jgi:hypothetical protein
MMKLLTLLSTTAFATASQLLNDAPPISSHRELSGDVISYDDDFWAYNVDLDVSAQTVWTDYNFLPTKCMV